jgi:S-adenosylmethionine:tRNA ribosyltransferase-isomerase
VAHRTAEFDYDLPPELIAQTPPARRGESRLLLYGQDAPPGPVRVRRPRTPALPPPGAIASRGFADLPECIHPGDLLVLNTTKVRHARLLGRRPSGAPAEVLLLHPGGEGTWVAMGTPGSALRPGKRIELGQGIAIETVALLDGGYRRVRVVGADAEAAMARLGRLPLPPYIAREATPEDDARYQTVYAEREGSVAAPTAGLHFTPALLDAVVARGARLARLDLEVGPGTFRPVEVEDYRAHPMHPERYVIPPEAADAIAGTRAAGHAVWAVGTTVVRALESAALPDGTVRAGEGETRLMIAPGHRFQVVDRLITNFHLPRSTLLMLVAAFIGLEVTREVYRFAVRERFRFYSYGDAMAVA